MSDAARAVPFDHMVIEQRLLTLEEFLALPLDLRVQYIVGGQIDFLRAGAMLPKRVGFAALRGVLGGG